MNILKLIILIFFIGILVSIFDGNNNNATYSYYENDVSKNKEIESVDDEIKDPEFEVTATEVINNYYENSIAADIKYRNKRFVIAGEVSQVGKDILDRPFIVLSDSNSSYRYVRCELIESQTNTAATLKKNDPIKIIGTGNGDILKNPEIKDCAIIG